MDMPDNHIQQMAAALPETMRLIQQDLLSIAQQVSIDRNIQLPGEIHDHGTSAASTAAYQDGTTAEGADDEVEVVVQEEDGDETGLMQTTACTPTHTARGRTMRWSEAQSKLLLLRDELEQMWVDGLEVRHAVAAVMEILTDDVDVDTQDASLDLIQQIVLVIPWNLAECKGCCMPLSPVIQKWVDKVAEVVKQMARLACEEEDRSSLMQRTLTGLMASPAKGQPGQAQRRAGQDAGRGGKDLGDEADPSSSPTPGSCVQLGRCPSSACGAHRKKGGHTLRSSSC